MYTHVEIREAVVDRDCFINPAETFASVQVATPDRRTFIELVSFEASTIQVIKSLAKGDLIEAVGDLGSHKGSDGRWRSRVRIGSIAKRAVQAEVEVEHQAVEPVAA